MTRRIVRRMAGAITLTVGLALAAQALGQTTERKPPPPPKEAAAKDGGAPSPAPKPRAPERKPGEERIRLDAPVSFPVDI